VDEGYCSAAAVELDPDMGCATYSAQDEKSKEDGWEEEEEEFEDWDEEDDDEDDDWLEEEDEF
jgi:hypothetical protein